MADPYMLDPTQYQGMFEPDPELVRKAQEQAKAMAALRMGLGMLGKEPLGRAAQGGFNTYFATQEDARRNAHEQQQMMMQRVKLAEELRKQKALQEVADNLDPTQLIAAGVSKQQIDYAKKNPEYLLELMKTLNPQTLSQGQVRYVPGVGIIDEIPDSNGFVNVRDPQTNRPIGKYQLPGYAEAKAREAGLTTGAQEAAKYPYNIQTNIPGPNGPISGLASDIYGTPGTKQATPQGTLPPQLDPRAKFSAAEKMRILQDITGEKPFEQVAGQTNVVQGRDPIDVTKAESQIKLGSELTGKTADVYLNTIKTDMPGVRQAVSQAIPLNHMALSMLDSGKVITGKGANIAIELGGWLAQAGFNKAEDKVANTQAFVLLQAREALAILGSRALGSGTGISAKDLEFAKDIAAGNITLTEEALRRLISLNEKAHRLKAQDYNKVVDEYAKQYQRPDALGLKVELPPEYSKPQANAMEPPPVAIQALRKNPGLAAEFKRKYGVDPALYLR